MDTDFNKADWEFFVVALREEARDVSWSVKLDVDPDTLIESALEDLQALAPKTSGLETRSREEIWKQVRERLVAAAYALRPHCIRCGVCCEKGSPTLLKQDDVLFINGIITPADVYTIRTGEQTYNADTQETAMADTEFIKIKEHPGGKTCIFLDSADKTCKIYGSRPIQCRRQECWIPKAPIERGDEMLSRKDLLGGAEDLWSIIEKHEQRCSHGEFSREITKLSATMGQTVDDLLNILAFDHHVRDFVKNNIGVDQSFLDFFFGRPLSAALGQYGLRLYENEDGTYYLTVDDQPGNNSSRRIAEND